MVPSSFEAVPQSAEKSKMSVFAYLRSTHQGLSNEYLDVIFSKDDGTTPQDDDTTTGDDFENIALAKVLRIL